MLTRKAVAAAAIALLGLASVPASANVALHPGAGCPGATQEGGGDNLVIRYAPGCGRTGDHHNVPHGLNGANSRVPAAVELLPDQPYVPGSPAAAESSRRAS